MTASLTESWRIVPRARCRCLNTWLSQNWGRGGVWKEIISETKAKQFPRVMRNYKLRIISGGYRVLQSHQSNCFCDEESKGLIFLKMELTKTDQPCTSSILKTNLAQLMCRADLLRTCLSLIFTGEDCIFYLCRWKLFIFYLCRWRGWSSPPLGSLIRPQGN